MRHTPYIYIYIRLYYYVHGLCISPPIYISEHLQVGNLQNLNRCQWPLTVAGGRLLISILSVSSSVALQSLTAIKLSELTSVCSGTLYTLI